MRKRFFMLYLVMAFVVSSPCAYGDETEPDEMAAPQMPAQQAGEETSLVQQGSAQEAGEEPLPEAENKNAKSAAPPQDENAKLSLTHENLTWDIQCIISRDIKRVWNTSAHRYDEIDLGEKISYIVADGSARGIGITNTGSVCAKWNASCTNPLFQISPASGILDAGENKTIEVMIQTSMLDGESNVQMISDYLDLSYSAVLE